MKIIVERDKLKDALAAVVGHTKGMKIPILEHVLIEASGQQIKITGHDLSSCTQVTIAAEVENPGAFAMPADRFNRLVAGMVTGSQVAISNDDEIKATVRAGRSTYNFNILPAADFPPALEMHDGLCIDLDAKQVTRLFKMPVSCVCDEHTRPQISGIYLHKEEGRLCAVATDGHTLIRTFVDIKPKDFAGIIIPKRACDEIAKIADGAGVTLEIGKNLVSAEMKGCRFISKIVDATYPEYRRVIPEGDVPSITIDVSSVDAALGRLVAATDPKATAAVKFSWDENPSQINVSLQSAFGHGAEEVESSCEGKEAGFIGAQLEYIRKLLDAVGGETAAFFFRGENDPIRIENPTDADTVAVLMPYRVS